MNQYLSHFLNSKGNRDPYFAMTLALFNNRPIKILEIGCARNLELWTRMSDGWSSFHFYNYIQKNGGQLTICDIDLIAVNNCKELFKGLNLTNVNITQEDGLKLIDSSYDLIYLDGSDDPKQMVEQYSKISKNTIVLCDDFSSKGILLRTLNPTFRSLRWNKNPHEMALYNYDNIYSEQYINCIQD